MKRLKKISLLLFGLLAPILALAAAADIIPNPIPGIPGTKNSSFNIELTTIISTVLGVAGILAVGFIIWGGFTYIISRGNEEQAEEGKKMIQNSIIGLIVVILSYVIVVVISRALIFGPQGV